MNMIMLLFTLGIASTTFGVPDPPKPPAKTPMLSDLPNIGKLFSSNLSQPHIGKPFSTVPTNRFQQGQREIRLLSELPQFGKLFRKTEPGTERERF